MIMLADPAAQIFSMPAGESSTRKLERDACRERLDRSVLPPSTQPDRKIALENVMQRQSTTPGDLSLDARVIVPMCPAARLPRNAICASAARTARTPSSIIVRPPASARHATRIVLTTRSSICSKAGSWSGRQNAASP